MKLAEWRKRRKNPTSAHTSETNRRNWTNRVGNKVFNLVQFFFFLLFALHASPMYRVRFDVETLLVFGMHFKNAAHVMLRNDNAFKLTILLNAQVNLFDRIHRKKFNAIPSVVLSSSFSPPHSPPSFTFYVHASMLLALQWAREKGIIFCVLWWREPNAAMCMGSEWPI